MIAPHIAKGGVIVLLAGTDAAAFLAAILTAASMYTVSHYRHAEVCHCRSSLATDDGILSDRYLRWQLPTIYQSLVLGG
jgi:hypothetical protein